MCGLCPNILDLVPGCPKTDFAKKNHPVLVQSEHGITTIPSSIHQVTVVTLNALYDCG